MGSSGTAIISWRFWNQPSTSSYNLLPNFCQGNSAISLANSFTEPSLPFGDSYRDLNRAINIIKKKMTLQLRNQ